VKLPKKVLGLGYRAKPKTQRDPDSEFGSIHFGIEIKKTKKIFGSKKLLKKIFFLFFLLKRLNRVL